MHTSDYVRLGPDGLPRKRVGTAIRNRSIPDRYAGYWIASELAEETNRSCEQIRADIKKGRIRCAVHGTVKLIPPAVVAEYIENCKGTTDKADGRQFYAPPEYKGYISLRTLSKRIGLSYMSVYRDLKLDLIKPIRNGRFLMVSPEEAGRYAQYVKTGRTADRRSNKPVTGLAPPATSPSLSPAPAAAPSTSGPLAAQAIKLFREGGNILDAVSTFEIPFETAEHLWNYFAKYSGYVCLQPSDVESIKTMIAWDERVPSAPGLVAAIRHFQIATTEKVERFYAQKRGAQPGLKIVSQESPPSEPSSAASPVALSDVERAALLSEEEPAPTHVKHPANPQQA